MFSCVANNPISAYSIAVLNDMFFRAPLKDGAIFLRDEKSRREGTLNCMSLQTFVLTQSH